MDPKTFLNLNVTSVTGKRVVEGEKYGLELELEGRNVALQDVAVKGWGRHHDGSLRGESVEYASNGPQDYEQARASIISLFKKFTEHKVKFNDSIRTSTHVHLNFSDKTVKQVVNFFSLFTVVEELLQFYSGEDRKGNLFCISSREAEGIVDVLATAIRIGGLAAFAGDRYKYAACNLSCLYKFGTIEIRTMKGATSAEQITAWLDILRDLYRYSLNMVSPADLIVDLSAMGGDAFLRKVFSPPSYRELMLHFPAALDVHYSLMEGARLLQVFAFEFDEAFKAKVEPKPAKVKKAAAEGGALPKRIAGGLHNGGMYCVYRADGGARWFVDSHEFNDGWWHDHERVADCNRIYFDAIIGRFVQVHAFNGEERVLNFAHHHVLNDEGPGPQFDENEEEDFEPDFDEEEERNDDF